MTTPHRATPEQWESWKQEVFASKIRSLLLELFDRVKELEKAQRIRSGSESPLVERVADAIVEQATSAGIVNDRPARAAILETAEWLAIHGWDGAADALIRQAR